MAVWSPRRSPAETRPGTPRVGSCETTASFVQRIIEANICKGRYADKYQCPQVFCWDGQTLLILQFQARKPENIKDTDCPIDCWVIPVEGSTCTLRYALYRLMVQGLRRCQASVANRPLTVGSLTEHRREFFNGRPIWKGDGQSYANHPEAMSGSLMRLREDCSIGETNWLRIRCGKPWGSGSYDLPLFLCLTLSLFLVPFLQTSAFGIGARFGRFWEGEPTFHSGM